MSGAGAGGPDWIAGDPAGLRRWRNARPEVVAPVLPADVSIIPVAAEGQCRGGLLFTPPDPSGADFVYFHGGGFIVGAPETHRIVAAWLAHLAGARVFSVRYRLAPEHALPAQADDAAAALRRWLIRFPHLRLAGDSAGALVALWGHAALTPAESARVAGALLIYGAAGLPIRPGPDDAALEAAGLGPKSVAAMYGRLDPNRLMPGNPAFDPLAADFPLPGRLCLLAAGEDPMLQDSLALAGRAGTAGIARHLIVAGGQAHGFLSYLPAGPALGALAEAVAWLIR